MPVNRARLEAHRRRNRWHTIVILVAIVAWMAGIGFLVAGAVGVAWAMTGAGLLLAIQPFQSPATLQRLLDAWPVDEDAAPELCAVVAELTRRAGLAHPPRLLYVPRPVVAALSFGRTDDAAIAVTDGMLRVLAPRPLAGVLAHEITHIRNHDLSLLRLAEAAASLTRFMATLGLVVSATMVLPAAMGIAMFPWAVVLMLMVAPLVADLALLALSRAREFAADSGGAELTGDPLGLALALEQLDARDASTWDSLGRRHHHGLAWLRSHPPTAERVARLRELAPARPPLPTDMAAMGGRRDRWVL